MLVFVLVQWSFKWMTDVESWNPILKLRCTYIKKCILCRLADSLPTQVKLLNVCLLRNIFPVIQVKTTYSQFDLCY